MADEKKEKYKLKDAETSFYDDETGLSVTRDETVEIGSGKGKRTVLMIKTGGLLKVDSSAAEGGDSKDTSTAPKSGKIPDDFPHAKVLADNGVTTFAKLSKMARAEIEGLTGVGPQFADDIETALGRTKK
jgi:hypothetical protein